MLAFHISERQAENIRNNSESDQEASYLWHYQLNELHVCPGSSRNSPEDDTGEYRRMLFKLSFYFPAEEL